jgi:hypothetical protein
LDNKKKLLKNPENKTIPVKPNPMGRPSKYDKSFVKKTKDYIKTFEKDEAVPTIEGLALYLGIPRNKVYEYGKVNEDFRGTVDIVVNLQAKKLISEGLKGNFNSSIVRLLLAVHGYRDEQTMEIRADESQISKIDQLLAKAAKIIESSK